MLFIIVTLNLIWKGCAIEITKHGEFYTNIFLVHVKLIQLIRHEFMGWGPNTQKAGESSNMDPKNVQV